MGRDSGGANTRQSAIQPRPLREGSMARSRTVLFLMVCAAMLYGCDVAPSTPTPQTAKHSAAASSSQSNAVEAPSAVGGGCSMTQIYSGPGPDASSGLTANPWAWASPREAGIAAYFFRRPPDLLVIHPGPTDTQNKILWMSRSGLAGDLIVTARPLDSASPVVRFRFPGGRDYPSLIDLPAPGCWRLDLVIGSTHATIDLMVAV